MLNEVVPPVTDDETFDQTEAPQILREFVCGTCYGELSIVFAKAHWRVLIVCQEHGNVCSCGRVTRNTVSIEYERSFSKFNSVIHALPDLWGSLIPPRQSREQNLHDLGF